MRTFQSRLALALAAALAAACSTATTSDAGVAASQVSVTVSPNSPQLYPSQSAAFAAAVSGTLNSAVTWTVTGGDANGTISTAGVYTAPTSTGTFEVVATSQAAPAVKGTATVTVVAAPPGGVPMTTANRTSGVAPLAVFFDAVNTTASGTAVPYTWTSGVTQPSDPEGATYEWDFGDPGSGNWGTTGKPKTTATGYTAAHVFENPGPYTVRLKVTDTAGNVTNYTQTITVTAFSGTTYYVSAAGSDSNNGTSPSTPFLTINKGMTTALAASGSVRVLFRRGDTFTASTSYSLAKSDPGCAVGAYGDGTAGHTATDARPVINVPELGDANVFSIQSPGNDWRVMDLEGHITSGTTNTNTGFVGGPVEPQIVNALFLRVKITGNSGVGIGWWVWNTTASSGTHDGIVVAECEVISSYNCAYYVGGRRFAIIGSSGVDGRATHITRVWGAHKGVVSNNSFLRPGGQRHALKLHGMEQQVSTTYPDTAYVSVTDNIFSGSSTSQWTVSIGSQSNLAPAETGPVRNVVLERNKWSGSPSTVADIESEAAHLMVRNNVFDDTAQGESYTLIYTQRNSGSWPTSDCRFVNNTVYKNSASSQANLVQTDSTASNVRVRNNLWGVSSTTNLDIATGAPSGGWNAAGNLLDHNLLTTTPGFTNAAGGDFSLATGSPAVDAGVSLPEVIRDYLGHARPVGSSSDLGAFESH